MIGKLLIAGSTGAVGRRVAQMATCPIRTLSRALLPGDHVAVDATAGVKHACDGVDVAFSALGASVAFQSPERRSYADVDTVANVNLIQEARRAGVRRFVYVAAHVEPGYADTAYIQAHEAVVKSLRESGLEYTVIRSTGIFTALDDLVRMAKRGAGFVIGTGGALTNPVHPQDVAQLCHNCLEAGPAEVSIGGPEVMSRRKIVETAFAAVGKAPQILQVPAGLMWFGVKLAGLSNQRLGELLAFAMAVSTNDSVAPSVGSRTLLTYFRERAFAGG